MGLITPEMRRMLEEQRLGFAATICEDGTANLSPKGTVTVLDDDHVMFADLASPQTVKNLRTNPSIEINVVDPVIRKGFRFKGRGIVVDPGERFAELLERFTAGPRAVRDATARIRHIVVIEVERAFPSSHPRTTRASPRETSPLAGSGISGSCGRRVGVRDVAPRTRGLPSI